MKTSPSSRPRARLGPFLPVIALCFVAAAAATHAAPPSVQTLLPGKWPAWGRGDAKDVKVVGQYAYVALDYAGLAVFDVSKRATLGYPQPEPSNPNGVAAL